jgi:hypothetical protein
MRHFVIALALLFVACAPQEPPAYISIDPSFSEGERETILAAVDTWCERAGWCPELALWSERGRFELVDTLEAHDMAACPEGRDCVVSGRNDGDRVRIARDRPLPEDMGVLFTIAAHEIGHFCTEHTSSGLMAAFQQASEGALDVDDVAVAAWHDGCP